MLKKISQFLTDIPGWFVLLLMFFSVLWLYGSSGDAFLQRLLDTIVGGVLGVLIGRRQTSQSMPIDTIAGDVNFSPAPAPPVEEVQE